MSENWGNIDELIVKHLTNSLTSDEGEQLNSWLNLSSDNQVYFEEVQAVWNHSSNIMAFDAIDVEEDYKQFASKVGFTNEKMIGKKVSFSFRNIAAMLLPLIAVSVALTLYQTTPGFGKWVAFSSSNEVESIVLPDNSMVDLNTHSKLVFEKSFDGRQRRLKLHGEGFFKVTKNPEQPFVVKVGNTEVKVLGTAFYLEETGVNGATNLIVTEGRVMFSSNEKNVIVSKGESASFINGEFEKVNDTPLNRMSWRTGVIEFEKTGMKEVLQTLKDHFTEDIEEIENKAEVTDRVITSKFNSPKLEEVLVELRIHFKKNFTMDGKKLIISD
nr:FecR domain-containing protein [uncultured Carboxylicivirga sp.]